MDSSIFGFFSIVTVFLVVKLDFLRLHFKHICDLIKIQNKIIIFFNLIFQRGHQTVSRLCKLIILAIGLFLGISLIVSIASVLKWIDFLYFCSYVKLFITLIKYMPQGYMNFRRKSTMGWSIGNVLVSISKKLC